MIERAITNEQLEGVADLVASDNPVDGVADQEASDEPAEDGADPGAADDPAEGGGDQPIPDMEPRGIEFLKRLQIYVSAGCGGPTEDLRFHICGYEDDDENGPGLSVKGDKRAKIREFVDAPFKQPAVAVVPQPTQLDFSVQEPCRVVLKLIGDFWEFAPNPAHGQICTKGANPDGRYRRLRVHRDSKGRVRAVSFYVQKVDDKQADPASNTKHGISLYVDFTDGKKRLPVIIDPDIENKGGYP